MPWSVLQTRRVDNPAAFPRQTFVLPGVSTTLFWSISWSPDSPSPGSWSRAGFFSPTLILDGRILSAPSVDFWSDAIGDGFIATHVDFTPLLSIPGVSARVSAFSIHVFLQRNLRPGNLLLWELT